MIKNQYVIEQIITANFSNVIGKRDRNNIVSVFAIDVSLHKMTFLL